MCRGPIPQEQRFVAGHSSEKLIENVFDPGLFTRSVSASVDAQRIGEFVRSGFDAIARPSFPQGSCRGVMFEEETEKRNSEESTSQNQR